jgi:hypothetical protein
VLDHLNCAVRATSARNGPGPGLDLDFPVVRKANMHADLHAVETPKAIDLSSLVTQVSEVKTSIILEQRAYTYVLLIQSTETGRCYPGRLSGVTVTLPLSVRGVHACCYTKAATPNAMFAKHTSTKLPRHRAALMSDVGAGRY